MAIRASAHALTRILRATGTRMPGDDDEDRADEDQDGPRPGPEADPAAGVFPDVLGGLLLRRGAPGRSSEPAASATPPTPLKTSMMLPHP